MIVDVIVHDHVYVNTLKTDYIANHGGDGVG